MQKVIASSVEATNCTFQPLWLPQRINFIIIFIIIIIYVGGKLIIYFILLFTFFSTTD